MAKAKVRGSWRVSLSGVGSRGAARAWPWLLGLALLVASGCSSGAKAAHPRANADSGVCAVDQVREFYCDGLLPMSTAVGAPAPYDSCPAGIEAPTGAYPRAEHVARFDATYTEWARRRAQPGHTCCYSWCSALKLAEVDDVLPYAGCDRPGAMRENYCFPELESGTTRAAPAPLDRCPLAVTPPESVSFSVPKAAPLDVAETQARHQRGDGSCCYGWCSRMPAGGLR
ncbi:MAG TPA: hypothetical protein VG937_21170 [Polyangiaceae bacterium]|nr:hypothetical protein [Polyangiaceae bacterium]